MAQKMSTNTNMKRIILLLALTLVALATQAQRKTVPAPVADKTRVLLILDCSNSMWDRWQSDSKIKVTQKVLLKFLDSVANQNDIEVALRVFGHLNKDSYGTKLEVPFGENNNYKIQSKIKTLVPNGGCTVATALTDALTDFPMSGSSRNIILIITDGMDDCDGNICDVARQVQLSGVIVKTFILGIGNPRDFQHNLDCAGRFSYLPNEEQYTETLYDIFRLSEQKAGVVVQVKDHEGMLYETDIPIAFYDAQTHVVKYNTIYSIDSHYQPDTLEVDPLTTYNITLFTQPPLEVKGRQFTPGKTEALTFEVEQGSLRVASEARRVPWTVPHYPVVVRQQGANAVLADQTLGDKVPLRAGHYDIDVLTLPVTRLSGVEVRNASTTDLVIPMPGLLNLAKPKVITTGSVFHFNDGKLIWVCDLNPNTTNDRLCLMPGEYQIVIKPQGETAYKAVQTQRFRIESAQQTNITLQ